MKQLIQMLQKTQELKDTYFSYDRFVRWFHEIAFNESTDFSKKNFNVMFFLEAYLNFDCNQN